MAAKTVLNYLPRESVIHKMTGTTKLAFFLLFTFASMITYNTWVLLGLLVVSLLAFRLSRIKFRDHLLELTRQGTSEVHMIFEENQRHMIPYNTPYGQLMLGIETGRVLVEEQEDQIHVTVEYTLDHEGEPLSESCLKIHIREK